MVNKRYVKKVYKRKFKGKQKQIEKVVKKVIGKAQEHKIFATAALNQTGLLHNTMYTLSPIAFVRGGNPDQFIGSQIYLKEITMGGTISNKTTQAEVSFRILTVWSDDKYALDWSDLSLLSSGIGATSIFYSNVNLIGAMINNKTTTRVISDKLITCKTDVSGAVKTSKVRIKVPIRKKLTFVGSSGSNLVKEQQLYVVIIPWTPSGSTGSTTVGVFNMQCLASYTDS